MSPERFMRRALTCAKKAAALGEVPVGAVVVLHGAVIASGYNRRETGKDALLHAEMIAIHRACRKLGRWRLNDCDLYVTLEPCPMCAGAIINARIRRVFIGAMDPKAGCMGSVCDLSAMPLNHRPEVITGVLQESCSAQLSSFFQELRRTETTDPQEMILRPFTYDDLPVLKHYCYGKRSDASIRSILDQWNTRLYEGRYFEQFAVSVGETVVGMISLCEQSEGTVSVGADIFSDYRGKGYGTRAVTMLFRVASQRGYHTATARVRKENTPSLRLCRHVGFVPVGEDVTAKGRAVLCFSRKLDEKTH